MTALRRAAAAAAAIVSLALGACGGGGGTDAIGASAPPTVTVAANPMSVAVGGSTTLTWSSTDATSCTASGGWSGTKAISGSETINNLQAAATFTLSCSGAAGSAQGSAQVSVSGGVPPPVPTVTLSANPTSVASGGGTTLTWSSTNATSCTASGSWSGVTAVSGNQTIASLTQTSTFTLACSGAGGSAQSSVQVTVTAGAPAPTLTLAATPATVAVNGSSQLTWTSTNATSCTASGGWTGSKATSGSQSVGPLANTAVFSLSCTGAGGSVQRSITVTVSGAGGSAGLSGAVDSSYINPHGGNRIYLFNGSVTPDDDDGDAGDPAFIVDVVQDENACTFSFALPSIPPGTYTLAFTSQGDLDRLGQPDTITFQATAAVTIGSTPLTHDVVATNILRAGPGRQFATIGAAAASAAAGAVIEVDPGDYRDDIVVWRNRVVVRGVGGARPHVIGTKVIPFSSGDDLENGKGIWVVTATGVRIENFEISGARVTDENGAAVRGEGRDLTLCNGYFHDNENGFLGDVSGTLTIEYSTYANNGIGDGFTHNVYVGSTGSNDELLVFRHNNSHHARIGHTLKTRARQNMILYNRLMDEQDGTSSYNIDVPNGGLTFIIGNQIQQGPNTDNSAIVAYGAEGVGSDRTNNLYVSNNTLVNDRGSGTFLSVDGNTTTFVSTNNLFVGGGTVASGKQPQASNNLATDSPGFLNRVGFDYHLTSGSPARDAGTNPGTASGVSLVPIYQYRDSAQRIARPSVGALDIGAFEFEP